MKRSGLLILAAAVLAGCGSSSFARANYPSVGLSFTYPSSWHRNDCGTTASSHGMYAEFGTVDVGTGPACTWSNAELGRNAVVVYWETSGNAPVRVSSIPGEKLTVDGHAARLRIIPAAKIGSGCQTVSGAERAMVAAIEWTGANAFFVHACWRGPDFAAGESAVRQMVQSVQIAKI